MNLAQHLAGYGFSTNVFPEEIAAVSSQIGAAALEPMQTLRG